MMAARSAESRCAAEAVLQNTVEQNSQHSNRRNYGATTSVSEASSRRRARRVCCGLMSDVRRTFCLIVTFDLILTFVLWGIFVQLREPSHANETLSTSYKLNQHNFYEEVVHFDIKASLFDVLVCGILRFLLLIFAYGLFRLHNPSVIAVTTFVTSVYVIVKVFLFQHYRSDPPSYILLISSFVISWVETLFLDFRVLPKERSSSLRLLEGDRTSLLGSEHFENFCTPEGSDDEDEERIVIRGNSSTANSEFRRKAEDAWKQAWILFNIHDGWMREISVEDIIIHSQSFKELGKVFRVEATIDASADVVFNMTTVQFSEIPSWNSTVMESRILQSIESSLDVSYSVTAPAGKGMVSSRDFVTVRLWKQTDTGILLSAGSAVRHHLMPEQKQHVRGENRITGWLYEPVPNKPNQCILRMVVGTDIKGWIPQMVVDQALTGVLVDSIRNLRKHISQ